ncbi:MAG: lasso peptide biosynthesis B2 protein [Gemmatimonadota bacterium]|nr:lasso peptide biosynthesis B2 protein [Gemmatimonadota bacterium]
MTSTSEHVSRETFASRSNVLLALRMSGWVLGLPFAKRLVPIERLARMMWRDGARERLPQRELFTMRLACRLTRFSGSNCLDRSLILYRYLAGAGASPTLVLGIGKEGRYGHAWILVDGVAVADSDAELERYEGIVAFGAWGRRVSAVAPTPRISR